LHLGEQIPAITIFGFVHRLQFLISSQELHPVEHGKQLCPLGYVAEGQLSKHLPFTKNFVESQTEHSSVLAVVHFLQ
jgi:hypothetical protein